MENKNRRRRGLSGLLSSPKGQTFMNMAYSFGAAIVILGAMFKILHLDYGTEMLMLGMTMEVLIFSLSAFDRSDEDKSMDWSRVFPVLKTGREEDNPLQNIAENGIKVSGSTMPSATSPMGMPSLSAEQSATFAQSMAKFNEAAQHFGRMAEMSERMHHTSETYVDNLSNLNRNIDGLGRAYAEQLNNLTSQIRAISSAQEELSRMNRMFEGSAEHGERFRRETERLADQLAQLNAIYGRMIHAMSPPSSGRPIY